MFAAGGPHRDPVARAAVHARPAQPPAAGRCLAGQAHDQRHRVVVVGGGFGGLFATRALGWSPVDVTLVDRQPHHLFQPMLYQVATGIVSEGEIAPPLRHILRYQENAAVLLAEVTGFDLQERIANAVRPDGAPIAIPFDSLIVAAGAGRPTSATMSWRRARARDEDAGRRAPAAAAAAAVARDGRADRRCPAARRVFDDRHRRRGATGVEISGQIRALVTKTLGAGFRRIDPEHVRGPAGRRRSRAAARVRRSPVAHRRAGARAAGCRAADGRQGLRGRRRVGHPRRSAGPRTDPGAHGDLGGGRAGVAAGETACRGVG